MIDDGLVYRWLVANHLATGARLPSLQILAKLCGSTFHRARLEMLALEASGVIRRRSPRSFVVHQALPMPEIPESLHPRRAMILAEQTFEPPGWHDRSLTALFEGMYRTANACDLEAAIFTPDDTTLRRIPMLARTRPIGWILPQKISSGGVREQFLTALRNVDQPVVVHGDILAPAVIAEMPWDLVCADHRGGARTLVHHMAQRGCRRLLPLTAPSWLRKNNDFHTSRWYVERHAGYAEGCAEAGIALLPARPWLPELTASCQELFEESVLTMSGVLAAVFGGPDPPDGLIALEDGQALVLGTVCQHLGHPLPVAGFDATWTKRPEAAWGVPPAVTWDQDRDGIGVALTHALIARAGNTHAPRRTILVPGCLIVP